MPREIPFHRSVQTSKDGLSHQEEVVVRVVVAFTFAHSKVFGNVFKGCLGKRAHAAYVVRQGPQLNIRSGCAAVHRRMQGRHLKAAGLHPATPPT